MKQELKHGLRFVLLVVGSYCVFVGIVHFVFHDALVGYRLAQVNAQQNPSTNNLMPTLIPGQIYHLIPNNGPPVTFKAGQTISVTPIPQGYTPCDRYGNASWDISQTDECRDPSQTLKQCQAGTVEHFCNPTTGGKLQVVSPSTAAYDAAQQKGAQWPQPYQQPETGWQN